MNTTLTLDIIGQIIDEALEKQVTGRIIEVVPGAYEQLKASIMEDKSLIFDSAIDPNPPYIEYRGFVIRPFRLDCLYFETLKEDREEKE